jgi:hypothetical protein
MIYPSLIWVWAYLMDFSWLRSITKADSTSAGEFRVAIIANWII